METDSQRLTDTQAGGQKGEMVAMPPSTKPTKLGRKKPVSAGNASKGKSAQTGTEHAALEEERRKAAAAQAAVEDLQQRLAAVEAALAEERQLSAAAQQALTEQRLAAETHPETSTSSTEQVPEGQPAFSLLPLTGFSGTDVFNVSRQVFEQAIKQPPLVLKHYTNFFLEMGRVMTGRSTVEPSAKDKRFTDEMWKTNPFYQALLQTYLTWQQSLDAFINDAYIIAGITDHITPWQGCYATTQLLRGKVKFILSNSGHIQAILNPPGNPKASYFVNDRYPADPEQWQARAQKRAGSWWEEWRDWLGQRSGEQRAAPRELGNEQYQPGTPAPGTYVFEP